MSAQNVIWKCQNCGGLFRVADNCSCARPKWEQPLTQADLMAAGYRILAPGEMTPEEDAFEKVAHSRKRLTPDPLEKAIQETQDRIRDAFQGVRGESRFKVTLKRIASYDTSERLLKRRWDDRGLVDGNEALKYAYKNVREEVKRAIKNRRRPKS